jgi:DNA-directed RNA polymerase specialized sigma subunit
MTNEELVRRYYDGDEAALEKLYHKNLGLIRSIAKETAADFSCLTVDEHHPNQFSAYTKTVLDDLCGEGVLELLTRIQSREYDESRAALTTYLYPHLRGRMTRWLEQNLGCMTLSKDEMAAVRQAQRLYHVAWKDTGEIAEELGVSEARVSRYVRYNTHFLGVHDLVPEDYEGDPYERLMPGMLSVSAEQAVYRKVCIELLRELFDTLPKKDRDILGKAYGVFGYPEATLKEIGMYHMMKESAVEKSKNRAVEKLRESYPGSRLQVWRTVHRMMRRPIPPPGDDSELRRNFPQYVRALAEVYGVLSEATSGINNISV